MVGESQRSEAMAPNQRENASDSAVAVSVCIVASDEESMIRECLESVKTFADETVVVLDSRSADHTGEICAAHGARVERHEWMGHVKQKDHCVNLAENDWVFCIDADERASTELAQRIQTMKRQGFGADAYEVNRRNFYLGEWMQYGGWYPDRKVRLFNRKKARWGGVNPHDRVMLDEGAVCERLDLDLVHYPYSDLAHHVRVINSYAGIAAREMGNRGAQFVTFHLVANPIAKFLKTYVVQAGFLAGVRGFIHAVMGSYLVFLKYAELWESRKNKRPDDSG